MDWIDKKLYPDEEIVFLTRPHWSIFHRSATIFIVSTFVWWLIFPALAFLLFEAFIFFTHRFVVTNRRFIRKRGLYYIRIEDWPLHKIENVICTKTIGDRLRGSGSVILMGISISKHYLRRVGNPEKLRNAIYSQLPAK